MNIALGECVICGEEVWSDDDPAEMHLPDPRRDSQEKICGLTLVEWFGSGKGGIVHAQCGLSAGWQIS